MVNIKQSIEDTISLIIETTDLFYQQKDKEGYEKLNIMFGKLIELTDLLQNDSSKVEFDQNVFNSNLMEAMNSLEAKDTVMMSDILVFEIARQLENVKELL